MADHGLSVMSVVDRPRQAVGKGLLRAWRDWAGVPRGPLGWVSTHTILNTSTVVFRNVAQVCQLRDDDVLLDLGCGAGGFLAGQAGHVQHVAGIDLSDLQVDQARKTLAERIAAGTAEIVHGDAAQLPWPDATFTAVTCMQVFEAVPDPEKVVAEVFRVLRPGGRAVLNIGERVPEGTQAHRAWGAIPVWAEDDVRAMLEAAGFIDVTIQYVPWGGDSPVDRLFAKVAGPIGGDLRLARGIRPQLV
jgi:SAM-dependent methyltransferase